MGTADAAVSKQTFQGVGKFKNRLARRQVPHPYPVPVCRRADAGAQRLGEGLLGGEALGEVGRRLPMRREALELGFAKNPSCKPVAAASQRLLDAPDLDHVGANAVDQRAACTISCFISRTA